MVVFVVVTDRSLPFAFSSCLVGAFVSPASVTLPQPAAMSNANTIAKRTESLDLIVEFVFMAAYYFLIVTIVINGRYNVTDKS